MAKLNASEEKMLAEISGWKAEEPGFLKKASDLASKPLRWIADKVLPDSVKDKMTELTETVVEKLQDASGWTVDERDVREELAKYGVKVDALAELKIASIHDLDTVAQSFVKSNSQIAAAEGFGTGLIGFPGLVADVPALLTLSFRLINQVSMCHGYEVTDKEEGLSEDESFEIGYMLRVLRVSTAATQEDKVQALLEMKDYENGYEESKLARSAANVTMQQVSKAAMIHLSKALVAQIVKQTVSRKAISAVPGIGAVIAAGFNYAWMQDLGHSATMLYRERFLLDKKGRARTINVNIE